MPNLYLSYPSIPFDAVERAQSVTFSEDHPVANSISGERYQGCKIPTAGTAGLCEMEWDLGVDESAAVDHMIIAHADKLQSQGATTVSLSQASDGLGGSFVEVFTDTGLATATLYGPDSKDYMVLTTANIIEDTERFGTDKWTLNDATISSNAIANPIDGTVDADKLVEGSNNDWHYVAQDVTAATLTNATSYRFSCYAKSGERTNIALMLDTAFTANPRGFFNLSAGTCSSANGGTASIESVGNGWYRCTLTATSDAASYPDCFIYLVSTGTTFLYTGNGTNGAYIWGANFTLASAATTYLSNEGRILNTVTAARTWKQTITGGAEDERSFSKIYFGTAWNPGVDPDSWTISRPTDPGGRTVYEDGSNKLMRIADARYQISVTWSGVTDAAAQIFYDRIMEYWNRHKFFLYTAANHRILNSHKLMHVRLTDRPSCSRAEVSRSQVWTGYNTISCNFAEVRG